MPTRATGVFGQRDRELFRKRTGLRSDRWKQAAVEFNGYSAGSGWGHRGREMEDWEDYRHQRGQVTEHFGCPFWNEECYDHGCHQECYGTVAREWKFHGGWR